MEQDWVMDVLDNLRRYAGEQQMSQLEEALAAASQVAALELANRTEVLADRTRADESTAEDA